MAHKVLSSDMAKLVNAMKLAQQYRSTVLDQEYHKGMLKAGHTLALDARALLQAVDNGRQTLQLMQQVQLASSNDVLGNDLVERVDDRKNESTNADGCGKSMNDSARNTPDGSIKMSSAENNDNLLVQNT